MVSRCVIVVMKKDQMKYKEFLKNKTSENRRAGFDPDNLNPLLFPFQKHIVSLACQKGRYAVFADCGLGKTFIQLEWARLVSEREKKQDQ